MLPSTARRVQSHTAPESNERIRQKTTENLVKYRNAPAEAIDERLWELEHEWDIERAIEATAASLALSGLALGIVKHRAFLVLPVGVCAFLLQHSLQGWCPPVPVLRRIGFRTQIEIEAERRVLRSMRSASVTAEHLNP